jgi:hypothetical protein
MSERRESAKNKIVLSDKEKNKKGTFLHPCIYMDGGEIK